MSSFVSNRARDISGSLCFLQDLSGIRSNPTHIGSVSQFRLQAEEPSKPLSSSPYNDMALGCSVHLERHVKEIDMLYFLQLTNVRIGYHQEYIIIANAHIVDTLAPGQMLAYL